MFEAPPEFDASWYRAQDPALAHLDDDAAQAHYREIGQAEGRPASPLALRENLLAAIGEDRTILEIGPFHSPMKRGPRVHYLDALDAEGLRERAMELGRNPDGVPGTIQHVGDLGGVEQSYDVLLGAHSIEHQPDLIAHLRDAERVLNPGGAYCLIVPHKRFCFDHFMAESTVAQVIQAWHEQRRTHTLRSVIEHRALTTHNNTVRHWAGDHGDPRRNQVVRVQAALEEYERAEGGYIDVHAWYFTPRSFRSILTTLHALGLIGLAPTRVYGRVHNRNEFCAILQAG